MASEVPDVDAGIVIEEDAAISVPDSADTGEGGKLKMIVQLVKKCLGVKDIAAMRLSLPASLLEPIPNLEFSQYLDRPDMFAAINDSDDAFERMLAVIRFAFTKDLKFVHGKVCKPYNSVLGEHFRAHWDFQPVAYHADRDYPPINHSHIDPTASTTPLSPIEVSETDSVKSGRSSKSTRSGFSMSSNVPGKSPSTAPTSVEDQMSNLSIGAGGGGAPIRVIYLTEQISHHPPVSAYYALCPSRSIELYGIDQISAKVSGTTLRIAPGALNKGIFVKIGGGYGQGEEYHISHPTAAVNGILRGNFYVTVSESTVITCTGGKGGLKYRAIIEYKEESWLGRAHFLVEGVVHVVHEGETGYEEWTKVKHVPKNRVVAVFEGTWHGLVRWRRTENFAAATSSVASSPSPSHVQLPRPPIPSSPASRADLSIGMSNDWVPLLDLAVLKVMPKSVRPLEKQLPRESRKLWEGVTSRLLKKEFGDATKVKLAIEQKQRDEAAERKKKGLEFIPKYFERDIDSGRPALTAEGQKAVQEEVNEEPFECAGAPAKSIS